MNELKIYCSGISDSKLAIVLEAGREEFHKLDQAVIDAAEIECKDIKDHAYKMASTFGNTEWLAILNQSSLLLEHFLTLFQRTTIRKNEHDANCKVFPTGVDAACNCSLSVNQLEARPVEHLEQGPNNAL